MPKEASLWYIPKDKISITKEFLSGLEPHYTKALDRKDHEPFEYFVDFDEPTENPISDEELYGS